MIQTKPISSRIFFKTILFSWVLLVLFSGSGTIQAIALDLNNPDEKAFVVVIPSFNNKEWYQKNLDSVFLQKYSNFRIIYVDDASPDGTGELVKAYTKEKGLQDRVTLIQNEKRIGSLANLYQAILQCNPKEIVVDLDGDDWMKDHEVLSELNSVYRNSDVWVTYGQFEYYPCGSTGWAKEVPQQVIEANAFRDESWTTTALRTFYAGLFQKIKKDDLMFNGEFYPMAGDLAFMFPIVEMAGKHSRFIPKVLYVYNVVTTINDGVKDPELQQNLGICIRMKNRYQPVETPW